MAYEAHSIFWDKFKAMWENIAPILVPGAMFLTRFHETIESKKYAVFTVHGATDRNVPDLLNAQLKGVRIETQNISPDNHLALYNAGYSVYSQGGMSTIREPWVTNSGRVRQGGIYESYAPRHITMMRAEHEVQP